MAEFCEAMRQAKRMCKQYIDGCTGCPLVNNNERCLLEVGNIDCVPQEFKLDVLAEGERIVMDWAAAHPEPRYPSWEEWWRREFPVAENSISPCTFGLRERFARCDHGCDTCRKQPIPADIAKKLGIKPIGGDGNV